MATRKEFVLEVTNELQANPRAVLAGHGIPAVVLKAISTRPDVLAKLAAFAYMTKKAPSGAKSLKKNPVLKISGYKNFPDFNKNARLDVENFYSALSEKDAESFTNSDNIITIMLLPDTTSGDTENDIISGKSVALKFDTSVKKEYKIPGGMYLTIMFGDSLIKTAEATQAKAKANINEKKVAKKQKSVALVKKELMRKAKLKMAPIDSKLQKLNREAGIAGAAMQQYARIGKEYGADMSVAGNVKRAMDAYSKEIKAFLKAMTSAEKAVYKEAMKAMANGDKVRVTRLLRSVNNPTLTKIVRGGGKITVEDKTSARKAELRTQVKAIQAKNDQLLTRLEASGNAREKAQIRFDMKRNLARIEDLKAKIGVYKDVSATAINKKAALLKGTQKTIADLIAKGNSVQQALNLAIGKLPVENQVKQQVKQQIIQEIANDMPTQYAVQQALQAVQTSQIIDLDSEEDLIDVFGDNDVLDAASLVGSADVSSILNLL